MIKFINEIKGFGIFKDYKRDKDLREFNKYNLIYGWNGCGKTTLSRLFACIEKRKNSLHFENCSFKILTESGEIGLHNLDGTVLNVYVFNQDFITENINWNEVLKSVLLVSEEKIEETKNLNELKSKKTSLVEEYNNLLTSKTTDHNSILTFLSETARETKRNFQVLDTNDNRYLNYDRTKLKDFIQTNIDLIREKQVTLPENELLHLQKSIQPNIFDRIDFKFQLISREAFLHLLNENLALISRSLTTISITRFKNYPDISEWVERGLELHKKHESRYCEFCAHEVSDQRIEELEEHFNDSLKELKRLLIENLEKINKTKIPVSQVPSFSLLYPEYHNEYKSFMSELNFLNSSLEKFYQDVEDKATQKLNEPFKVINSTIEFPEQLISEYNAIVEKLNAIISKHNNKTVNHNDELSKAKRKLELHYTQEALSNFQYFSKVKQLTETEGVIASKGKEIEDLESEIRKIETSLSNESLGAAKFNILLHKFLNHTELSLVFDKNAKGYKIRRGADEKPARNLSEGEKTAIAFVYFITKLQEKNRNVKESIIIIDDPISSFDSNHLFNSYSFLKHYCENALQLIILTHNFVFFKLIRDWLKKKNKKELVRSNFYVIEVNTETTRQSTLKNANKTLVDYNSEYHYLFSQLLKFKNESQLSLSNCFLIANISRKLLESFLAFKFPKYRSDFKALVDKALSDTPSREQIYRFINKYSHNAEIEFYDSSLDNLLGESSDVVGKILKTIEDLDKTHYDEMVEIAIES